MVHYSLGTHGATFGPAGTVLSFPLCPVEAVKGKYMDQEIQRYLSKYPESIQTLFLQLRKLLLESTDIPTEEMLWAKLPSYYAGEKFVRLIPF